MKTYEKEIATNPKAELIHLSLDGDEKTATAWAQKENMPWPTLLKDDTDTKKLITPYFPDGRLGVPTYILVDSTGKELARGKAAAFKMIQDNM